MALGLGLLPCFLSGQSTSLLKLKSNHLPSDQVLKTWSQISGSQLNYRASDLDDTTHTFSLEGTIQDIEAQLYPLLGLNYKRVDNITILSKATDQSDLIDHTLRITIHDEYGHPLPYAHLLIASLDIIDVTSADGVVDINMPIASSDTMSIRYMGYQDVFITVSQLANQDNIVRMKPAREALSEIIVLGKHHHTTTVQALSPEDIPQAGSVDNDALTIAQNLTGISNPSESFQDLIIRGGTPDQVQYQWNGIRVLQSSHFFGKISAINPMMVDKLEVSKDGYSASANGTISGGLHMKSSDYVDQLSARMHTNMLYSNVGLSIPISERLSIKVASRQSHPSAWQSPLARTFSDQVFQFGKIPDTDFFLDAFDIEDFVRKQTGVTFNDQQASIRYRPSTRTTFSADIIRIHNNLDFETISEDFGQFTLDNLAQSNVGGHIDLHHIWSQHFSTSVNAHFSDYSYLYREFPESFNESFIRAEQSNDVTIGQVAWSNTFAYRLLTANIGYELNTLSSNVFLGDRQDSTNDFLYERSAREHALYATLSPRLSRNLYLDIGLRWSAYDKSYEGRKLIEPRLHGRYQIHNNLSIHGHYGAYHQYLNRRNFFTTLQADNGFWFLSDETADNLIDIIQSRQYGGGINYSKGIYSSSINVYKKDVENLWSESLDFSIEENPYRFGDLSSSGIEVSTAIQTKHQHLRITYEYTDEDITLDFFDGGSTLNPFSQPHRLGLTFEQGWKIWTATLQYNYADGRPFTQAVDLIREVDDGGEIIDQSINFEDLLSERVNKYHRVDLSIRGALLGSKVKHSFGLQVNNLFNQANIIKNQYFLDYKVEPVGLGFLSKGGLPRSINLFWEIALN